jgi:hypothetical protein
MPAGAFDRASRLLAQLLVDLNAIEAADPDSFARSRAITQYTTTYAALGRVRLEAAW